MKAKIYTKTGDGGETALVGGQRCSKSHPRIEAYGTVDELNSVLGMAASALPRSGFHDRIVTLQKIQNELFNLGSRLACEDKKLLRDLPAITDAHIQDLEKHMDDWEGKMAPLTTFILPGGSSASATLHLARAICRRAERRALALHEKEPLEPNLLIYLNRLSDFLFMMARKINADLSINDIEWKK